MLEAENKKLRASSSGSYSSGSVTTFTTTDSSPAVGEVLTCPPQSTVHSKENFCLPGHLLCGITYAFLRVNQLQQPCSSEGAFSHTFLHTFQTLIPTREWAPVFAVTPALYNASALHCLFVWGGCVCVGWMCLLTSGQ